MYVNVCLFDFHSKQATNGISVWLAAQQSFMENGAFPCWQCLPVCVCECMWANALVHACAVKEIYNMIAPVVYTASLRLLTRLPQCRHFPWCSVIYTSIYNIYIYLYMHLLAFIFIPWTKEGRRMNYRTP